MRLTMMCLLFVFMLACKPEDAVPTQPVQDSEFKVANATLLKQGTLEGIGHNASGIAHLYEYNGRNVVYFDPFSSQNGPDLKVYLSKDAAASDYIRLGPLKSTMGMQAYDVPGNFDVTSYHYVHIWCEKYTVVFARAEIK